MQGKPSGFGEGPKVGGTQRASERGSNQNVRICKQYVSPERVQSFANRDIHYRKVLTIIVMMCPQKTIAMGNAGGMNAQQGYGGMISVVNTQCSSCGSCRSSG